ncbi:MAG: OmpA family protein [Bacteroidales bacterium]|nr:OmpA family protein [Bacteroidales bacterium]
MKKQLFILLFFLISQNILLAQNIDFKKSNFKDRSEELKSVSEKLSKAEDFMEAAFSKKSRDESHTLWFYNALKLFREAYEFNPDNAELNFKIGKCLLQTSEKTSAIEYLEKAIKLDHEVNYEVYFYLGKAHKFNYEFDKAEKNFKIFKSKLKNKDLELFSEKIKKEIRECKSGTDHVNNPSRVWIENMNELNSEYDDYGACISADESVLVFNSRKKGTIPHMQEAKNPNEDFSSDIYISYLENRQWTLAEKMGQSLNTEGEDEVVALSSDAQLMFLSRDNFGNRDLFQSDLIGNTWSVPKALFQNSINTDFNESHASFSHNKIKIYFITDNPYANKGGTDMFFSGRINARHVEEWGKAFTVGSELNTKYNEACIFMHPDGKTIYFTSKGHNSMGGYDIFKSVRLPGKWSDPINLGYPVNTVYDEKYISVSASGKHAYISSNRKEENQGGYDIYKVTFLGHEKPMIIDTEDHLLASHATPIPESTLEGPVMIDAKNLTVLKGRILDEFTKKAISADIEIVDNEKNEVISIFHSNSETGKFLISLPSGINYGIAVIAKDYLFYSENFNLPEMNDYQLVKKDIYLQNVCIGCKIVLRNVFFDIGKFMLRPESTPELERLHKLLNNIPRLKVEISGHTDNTGSEITNQKLSENRAKAVVEYLVRKGIGADRVNYKGYGSSEPMADNTTSKGRQLNRRTEFKIIEN